MNKVEHGYKTDPHQHLDPAARHLDAPLLQLDLVEELEALRRSKTSGKGHVAKTLAKHSDLRMVLIAFDPGGRLERHDAPGRVCIQVVDGQVVVRVGDEAVQLKAGGLLNIAPSLPHEVEAQAQSAVLVTIAWPST